MTELFSKAQDTVSSEKGMPTLPDPLKSLPGPMDEGGRGHVGASTSGSPITLLFRAHYRELVRFCRMRIRSEADAEDIVQSAFLAARQAYPDKGEEELRPLLFRIVRNLSLNHLKAHWNARRQGEDINEARLVCPQTATPEKLLMDAQHLAIAEAVLAAMPERRREVLRLHRFEGLTYDEIAERLSVGRSTVKREVAGALAELAGGLARAGGHSAGTAD